MMNIITLNGIEKYIALNQWSSRCAPVHTSVHENYFTVHRKNCKMKNIFLNDINFVFLSYIRHIIN